MKATQRNVNRLLQQRGQAMAEGLVVLAVLLILWLAMSWLGTLQDMALQARHASSYMAFAATRAFDDQAVQQMRAAYFSGPAHQWRDPTGRPLQSTDSQQLRLVSNRMVALAAQAQPGGEAAVASRLRAELGTADEGILQQTVVLDMYRGESAENSHLSISLFDNGSAVWPSLQRQTSILTGAGHAVHDSAVQQRLSVSHTAWAGSAQASYGLTTRIDSAMGAVDAGWRRSRPVADWLQAWAGHIPEHHFLP